MQETSNWGNLCWRFLGFSGRVFFRLWQGSLHLPARLKLEIGLVYFYVNFFFFSFISQINFCRARGVFSLVLWFKFLVSAASDSSYFRFFILFVAMDYLNKMCREEKCPFFLLNTESISFLLKTCKLINAQKYLYARNLIIHPTNLVNS